MGQMGFFDLSNRYTGLDAKNEPLAKIDEVVPWEDFRGCLDAVCRRSDKARKSRAGRKPWDAVVMFKTIILSALYNLSDDQVEHQIRDRLSFMRFLGLGLEDRVPDAKTVWLYREQLTQAGVIETLFETFDGHLKDQGYLAMGGQIIDASIVAARRCDNTPSRRSPGHGLEAEIAQLERGKLPEIPVPAWPQTATARLTNHPLSNREFLEVPYSDDSTIRANGADPRLVAIMERWGFTSGHLWHNPDPGHFEYVGPPQTGG